MKWLRKLRFMAEIKFRKVPWVTVTGVNENSVGLSWDAVPNADQYKVYKNGTYLTTRTAVTYPYIEAYTASSLNSATLYTFAVSAVISGREGRLSKAVSATTDPPPNVDTSPPTWPSSPILTVPSYTSSTVSLSCIQAEDNIGVVRYKFERSPDNGAGQPSGAWVTIQDNSLARTCTDTGLTASTLYHYRVSAYDAAFNGSSYGTADATTYPSLVTYGAGYDVVSYAVDTTNGWRTADDTASGWDFSFPLQSPPVLSGIWQFSNTATGLPSGFPGNHIYKINANWSTLEPTKGNYDIGGTFDVLETLGSEWDGIQVDLRGAVYSGLVTAPSWLAGEGIPQLTSIGSYDISHVNWYTRFRLLLDQIAAYTPPGSAYTVANHPRMLGFILHGVSTSAGEEADSIYLLSNPANHVATIQHAVTAFGSNSDVLCWVGEGRSWRDVNEPAIVTGGVGSRGGLIERFLRGSFTPYELDQDMYGASISPLETRTGQEAEQYYDAAGVAQTDQFYLTVDETYPCISDIRYYMDEIEEFKSSALNVAAKGWTDDLDKWQLIYRMGMIRALQMRRNSLAVEPRDTSLMDDNGYPGVTGVVYGAEGFISPALMNWVSVQLGRRVYSASEDASFEANEAFCLLCRMWARTYNPLPIGNGFGNNRVHNLERWLNQRESDTAGVGTTPAISIDMGYNPSGDDSALSSNPNISVIDIARTGTNIGFRLDNRMRFGSSIAVKATFYDTGSNWTLRYTTASGTSDVVHTASGATSAVKTRTFFLTDFSNTNDVNFRLIGDGTTPFMLIRVIKV